MKVTRKWTSCFTTFLLLGSSIALAVSIHFVYQAHADSGSNAGASSAIPGAYFAPYIDIGDDTGSKTLVQLSQESGDKYFTLGFIEAANRQCTPQWAGANVTLDNDNNSQNGATVIANTVKQQIADLQQAGGNVVISFGGADADNSLGGDLAQACSDAKSLEKAYQSVVDRYHVDHIEFDVQGIVSTDLAENARRDSAIKQLFTSEQNKGITLSISFMVPVLKEGLVNSSNSPEPSDGLDVVKGTIKDQVPVSVFNLMTMYYGSECSNCDMGIVAGQTADAVVKQLTGFYKKAKVPATQSEIYGQIGITPIVDNPSGVDPTESSLSTSSAHELLMYAQSHHIEELSIWNLNRDIQHQFAYSKILAVFSGSQNTCVTPTASVTPDASATATPDPSMTPDATATPDPSMTPEVCATPTATATPVATTEPTATPVATTEPTALKAATEPTATATPTGNSSMNGSRLKVMVTYYNDNGAMADGQQSHQGACAVFRSEFELGTTFDLYSSATSSSPVYHCTAEDTGSEVCTDHVDVFLPLSTEELLQMGTTTMYLQLTGVDQTVVQEAAANHPSSMGCESGHNP